MQHISVFRPSRIVSGLLIASMTLGQGVFAQPSEQDKSTRIQRQGSDRPSITPAEDIAEMLIGNTHDKAVSRRDLLEERKARQRSIAAPPRPKADFAPMEPIAPAQRMWTEQDLFEDPEQLAELWRHEQEHPSDRRLRNYQAFAGMPKEPDAGTKVAQSQWQPIGAGIFEPAGSQWHKTGRIRASQYVYDDELGYTTLYVASSGGGLFRLVNFLFFAMWQPVSDNFPAEPMVGAFLVDETDSDRILVATGDYGRRWGTGLYRSLDGGDSWHRTSLDPAPLNSFRIVQDSTNPNVVLLVGAKAVFDAPQVSGIWRSENFGGSWTQIYNGPVSDLKQDPAFPQFWLAGASGVGVLESSDGGRSFHAINGNGGTGLGGANTERINYTISESHPNYHYLLAGAPGGVMHGIFRSTNYGYTWTRIDQGDTISWGLATSTGAIAVDPDDPGRLFVGMGGAQWTDNADTANPADICWHLNGAGSSGCGPGIDGGHPDFHSFTFVPDAIDPDNTRVVITNDGGVYIYDWSTHTVDGSANLMGLNVGQHWPTYHGTLASSHSDPDIALAGTFDNGVVRIDVGAGQKVVAISGGDGSKVNISPDDSDDFFAGYGLGWRRAFNLDGTGWRTIDCSLMIPMAPGIQADTTPSFGHWMYTYENRDVWAKQVNTTCDWQRVNPSSSPIGPEGFRIQQLEQAVNSREYIFYTTGIGSKDLYVMQGAPIGTLTPELRTPPTGYMSIPDASAFADRSLLQPETIYYTSDLGSPIQAWLSTNAGDTWQNVRGNLATLLPDARYREMVGNPSNLNQLFMATDVGVLRSDDRGATWYKYMNGLPAVIDAMSIELVFDNAAEPTLYIGSFGRGWWKRVIDDAPAEAP